ncbi:MAG: alpha-2-macroglobulin family protein [Gammaproteobacteria bacterium]
MIKKFFAALFGDVSWKAPEWLRHLGQTATIKPKAFWGGIIAVILFLSLSIYGYLWYQAQPQPERVIAQVIPPKLTPNEHELVPDNVGIEFGIPANGELSSRAVAPLSMVGKTVTDGISMSPAMPGTWVWASDHHLTFTPDEDWPAGQTYTVKFDKRFFATGAKMASWSATFTTLPFQGVISQFKFYQDPLNPQVRQAIATIDFSYPVDTQSLDDRITLAYEGSGLLGSDSVKYTIKYDEHKRSAYLRSEALQLPKSERYLDLILAKGIKPLAGPSKTLELIKANVLIPDAGSYFKVSRATAAIVRNLQDRPEQVLAIETTVGVQQATLDKALHIYVLPKDHPGSSGEAAKENYAWQDPGEVTPAILALAKPLDIKTIPATRDYATLHSYQFAAATPSYLYIKIDKGITGFGDFALSNDYTAVIAVPDYPQEIAFLHKGALLALGTEEKLSVLVRGLGAVKFDIARVLPDDVNHLITQTSGDFSNPYFIDPSFNQNNISEIFSDIQNFDASDLAKAQYTALDLKKYINNKPNNGGVLGLFLLQAHGWDAERKLPLDTQANRLILITDLGLIVKDNSDGTHDVFVQSINKGTPVNQADVSILGKNGLALITHKTDATGHASFPDLQDFINDKEPTVYIVRLGNDVAFIPYSRGDRQLNYSKFDVGGVTTNQDDQAALTAYIFSDRGIYRPGDTAHIAMIVKQPFVLPQPAGLPLEVTIVDSRGVTVKDQKLTLNETGYLTFDFPTSANSATGQYFVNLFIVKDNHPSSQIGSTTINVAEFLPDRLRISAQLSPKSQQGWLSPTDLMAKVNLWNLYGAPAVNHRVSGKILLTPQAVNFKEYPDYVFIDPLLDPKAPPKVFNEALSETHTDENGEAAFDLKLDRFDKATYQLTVFAEGFEAEGGRSVTTQIQALVSPLSYLVGYKPDGDLAYIKQNDVRKVHFIAVSSSLKQQNLDHLKLQISRLQPVSTLVKREDGTYQYQSVIQTTQISSQDFAVTDQGVNYSLPSKEIGDFLLTLASDQGVELSHLKFSIVGASQQALPKNAELNVKLNKAEYAPGENIEMQIIAPYTGAGLISLERDKVHAFQWFKTDTTASMQKIQVPQDFQGDGYVNIAFVRDLNSPEIFMNPLSYSVLPFAVTHKEHDLAVSLTVPAVARPGDILPISYQTDKPSKIIVFAIDEGILQVSNYVSPDPTKFFFQKHALQVNTMQIVDQILPKFVADRELSAIGGDEGENAINKNLNPFKRKTDAPVVYWSGIIDADKDVRQLTYQIPDYFNGSLRVMAVAVADNAVGSASKATEVRGYFVINPNVPTFVAPNDEFEITASIANNVPDSGKNASVKVDLEASSGLEIIGNKTQTIEVSEGQENSVRFKVRAKAQLGSADLKLITSLNGKISHMSSTLSIRPASPYMTTLKSGYSTKNQTLALDRDLYPEYRDVLVAASPSPLILISGIQHYLNEYPYGCTEQLTSQGFPALMMANQPWQSAHAQELQNKVEKVIQLISLRQIDSGAFNYWPDIGTKSSDDFATVYAMHFLTEAKAAGFSVPNDMFFSGINFLKDFVTQDVKTIDQVRLQAYAIYVLTRNEIVTTSYLTHLQLALEQQPAIKWQNDIATVYMAATYQLLKSQADAERMLAKYDPNTKIIDADFYNKQIANAQYVFLIAKHFPEQLKKVDEKMLMSVIEAVNVDTISTVLLGYTSLALSAYGQYYPVDNAATLSINEVLANNKSTNLSIANNLYQQSPIDINAKQIELMTSKNQGYFYQLTQSGFNKTESKTFNNGIEVYREYRTADDATLSSVHLGDDIIVYIRVRTIDNLYHSNIAVVDLLPGGFEVVRDSINVKNMDYVDAREDRVIFFGSVEPDSKEIMYRIKATNIGKYLVPPVYGASMYNPLIKSVGKTATIEVQNN